MSQGESRDLGRVVAMRFSVLTGDDLATLSALSAVEAEDVGAACAEVARVIRRTPMAVRYHLGRLWGAGLVRVGAVALTIDGRCVVEGRRAA